MKSVLTFLALFLAATTFAQSDFPDFLEGVWKLEGKEKYERWDRLNEKTLKGFSYKMEDGQMFVSEYLEISQNEDEVFYTATVLDQNQGKGISFKLKKSDDVFVFENPEHDFPKKITYQKLGDRVILVQVSDGNQKGFSHKMYKQNAEPTQKGNTFANPNYDVALAKKLGADDYGMKSFVLAILKTGTNKTTDKAFTQKCFRGHLDNIDRLVEENKIIVAGPMGKNNKAYRGIFILDVASLEEGEKLLQTDPAIKNNLLDVELYKWYGSAALPEYLKMADKIWKKAP